MRISLPICARLLLAAAVLIGTQSANAQRSSSAARDLFRGANPLTKTNPSEAVGVSGVRIPQEMPEEAIFALDTPIDPASYVLGPGDVLGVSLRSGSGMFYQAVISPDGRVIVPRLPMLQLGGLTLAAAMDTAAMHWSSGVGKVDVALLQMRHVRVSIGGPVTEPGSFIVSPADRAATLVELAGGLIAGEASERRATLQLPGGHREQVDLLRYRRGGALDANPRLTGGAHLVIHPYSDNVPRVDIGGGVISPGSFEYLPGDSLLDLLDLGGGPLEEARLDSAILTRFSMDGQASEERVDLAAALAAGERGPAALPGDLLYIPMTRDWPERSTVRVQGEVRFPGTYPVVPGKTSLKELIQMAGGFTKHAWLRGARAWSSFKVNDVRHVEMERLDSLNAALFDDLETSYFQYYFRSMQRDYIPIDFVSAFEGGGEGPEASEITFSETEGVVLNVPRPMRSVLVVGQVRQAGHIAWDEAKSVKDYIREAGGYAGGAMRSQLRLVRYESTVWFKPGGGEEVYPGDLIFVPSKRVGTDWEQWSEVARIIISAGTLATLIVRTLAP